MQKNNFEEIDQNEETNTTQMDLRLVNDYTNEQLNLIIKKSIRQCLDFVPEVHKSDSLVLVLYNVLKTVYIEKIEHVVLSAPTGSGKSVIGYMLNFCFMFIENYLITGKIPVDYTEYDPYMAGKQTYMLTSSKMLQEQLEGDFDRFNINDYFSMLKGTKNYECTKQTEETKIFHDYSERYCVGMTMPQKEALDCFGTCPYIQQRYKTSDSNCSVLNYSYFLNVLKSPNNPFFRVRDFTISDEAHLIPEIILNQFNIELTQFPLLRIQKVIQGIEINFPKLFEDVLYDLQTDLGDCFRFFTIDKINLDFIEAYVNSYKELVKKLKASYDVQAEKNPVLKEMFNKEINKIVQALEYMDYSEYITDLKTRPGDTFIKSEYIGVTQYNTMGANLQQGSYKYYKHTVNDMSEAAMCRKYYLTKVKVCIYMSATIGNMVEFSELMGLEKSQWKGFRLQSNFDFSKSPIHIVKSGYLNYNNFNSQIDKCLLDTLRVCEHLHPKEKGIIHTSTFIISNLLKDKVLSLQGGVTNPKRYLFYSNSEEKDSCIELMKANTSIPYIIIGPSLYEGLDLKHDQGRFNILIKAPYSGMNDYVKEKMKRYPFWYERSVLEKMAQAIGRTNRAIDDWSHVYLIDSVLEKLVFKLDEHITSRLRYTKI